MQKGATERITHTKSGRAAGAAADAAGRAAEAAADGAQADAKSVVRKTAAGGAAAWTQAATRAIVHKDTGGVASSLATARNDEQGSPPATASADKQGLVFTGSPSSDAAVTDRAALAADITLGRTAGYGRRPSGAAKFYPWDAAKETAVGALRLGRRQQIEARAADAAAAAAVAAVHRYLPPRERSESQPAYNNAVTTRDVSRRRETPQRSGEEDARRSLERGA
jgi:hypothetical protein